MISARKLSSWRRKRILEKKTPSASTQCWPASLTVPTDINRVHLGLAVPSTGNNPLLLEHGTGNRVAFLLNFPTAHGSLP